MSRPVEDSNILCHAMFVSSLSQLQRWAWHAVNTTPEKNIVFCIMVDSYWRNLANRLLPNQDWQTARNHGLKPIAIGITNWEEIEQTLEPVPVLQRAKELKPPDGMVQVIILSDEGILVAEIRPVSPYTAH